MYQSTDSEDKTIALLYSYSYRRVNANGIATEGHSISPLDHSKSDMRKTCATFWTKSSIFLNIQIFVLCAIMLIFLHFVSHVFVFFVMGSLCDSYIQSVVLQRVVYK